MLTSITGQPLQGTRFGDICSGNPIMCQDKFIMTVQGKSQVITWMPVPKDFRSEEGGGRDSRRREKEMDCPMILTLTRDRPVTGSDVTFLGASNHQPLFTIVDKNKKVQSSFLTSHKTASLEKSLPSDVASRAVPRWF
ncbi:hypothetical protein RRG08_039871 [Elysia crispata]|uniref:Uncharacterized protein n=1 Tax=Elysia crispata TaxID=231223 RepID=A0AAE1DMY2_9GAST|nr:hypothetical protein RRG08_039871 [Elysia crispata]